MNTKPIIKRTTAGDPDFMFLIKQPNHELWNELKEDQATDDQYNKVPDIQTAAIDSSQNKTIA